MPIRGPSGLPALFLGVVRDMLRIRPAGPAATSGALAYALLITLVLCMASSPAPASTVIWLTSAGGDWSDAYHWSSYPYLPGSGDDAMINLTLPGIYVIDHSAGSHTVNSLYCNQILQISGGLLNLMNNSACTYGLRQSSGTLGGYGPLTIAGASQWTGGIITSLGGVTNSGVWDFSGSNTRYLQGYITNHGTINHTGTLDISVGANLYNAAGTTYEIKTDTGITSSAASGQFDNNGTFKKTTTTGTSSVACVFNNRSQVIANKGKIQFSGGGTWREGNIQTDSTTSGVAFSSGTYGIYDTCDWGGYGYTSLNGATLSMGMGSTLYCDLDAGLKIAGGLVSGLGRIVNTKIADWSAGTLSGLAGFENENTMTLSGSAFKYLENTPFTNKAFMTQTGAGSLVFSQSARFANYGAATYDIQNDGHFISLDGTGRVDNGGTLRKSYSYGTTYIDPFMNSSGILDVQSGVMELWGGGQFVNGGFSVNHLATLALQSGTFDVYGETQAGYGGYLALSGGTLSFTEGATLRGSLEQGISLAGSTVTGHGNLVNGYNMNWSSGTITGTTHFINEGALTISSGITKDLSNAEFYNTGTTIQNAFVGPTMSSGAVLNNQSTGTYEFRADSGIQGAGTINNAGIFTKDWSSGVSTIEPTFNNTAGTISLDEGTIRLAGGGSFTGGGGSITSPGVLDIYSGAYSVSGQPTFSGTGLVTIDGGSLNLGTGAQFRCGLDQGLTLSAGTVTGPGSVVNTAAMNWSGGTITGTAHLTNQGTLTISGSSQKLLTNAEFHNMEDTIQTASTGLQMASGALLSNTTGSSFELRTDAGISGSGTINYSGTFRKSQGSGISVIEPSFNSIEGWLDVDTGSLKLMGGGGFNLGAGEISAQSNLYLTAGTFSVTDRTDFTGDGKVYLNGGTLAFNVGGRLHFPLTQGFHFSSGTMAGNGAVLVESVGDWSTGIIAEDAALENHGTFSLLGTDPKLLRRGRLVTFSRLNHTGLATVDVDEHSSIEVASGFYDFPSDGDVTGAGRFYVGSTLRKTGGTGTSVVAPNLDCPGVVEVMSGRLTFTGPCTQLVDGALTAGHWNVLGGCRLDLGEQPITANAAEVNLTGDARFPQFDSVLTNSGTLRLLDRRSFTASNPFTNSGTLVQDGGDFLSRKNLNTGTWTGWGYVDGGFTNRGKLSITQGEQFRTAGSYYSYAESTLEVTIAGKQATQFSKLGSGGAAYLGGTLKLNFTGGFVPQRGDTFEIITCRSRSGSFAFIDGYILGNGLFVNAIYTSNSVVLIVGDYMPTPTEIGSVAATRQQTAAAWVSFPGIVSAVFADGYFVQDSNRAAGIRVTGNQTPPVVGQRIHVAGQLQPYGPCLTLTTGEWFAYADPIAPPRPLGMTERNLGGAALGLQGGIWQASGLNNVGLLVTIVGRIRYQSAGAFIYIDDGSGITDGNTLGSGGTTIKGVKVILPAGVSVPDSKWVAVTGISQRQYILDRPQRALLARSQEDIVPFY